MTFVILRKVRLINTIEANPEQETDIYTTTLFVYLYCLYISLVLLLQQSLIVIFIFGSNFSTPKNLEHC